MLMERGFKSRCENIAIGLRRELGLTRTAPLSPYALAAYLEIPVLKLSDIPGLDSSDIRQLLVVDPDAWSAITVSNAGRDAIIINPSHRGGRPATDIMHEIAHLLLGHEPSTMFYVGDDDIALRGYNRGAEEEASWLAGALLLPREALTRIRSRGISDAEARTEYGVSQDLLRFRTDVTGINFQFSGRRRSAR
jgi:hypothetical protein